MSRKKTTEETAVTDPEETTPEEVLPDVARRLDYSEGGTSGWHLAAMEDAAAE